MKIWNIIFAAILLTACGTTTPSARLELDTKGITTPPPEPAEPTIKEVIKTISQPVSVKTFYGDKTLASVTKTTYDTFGLLKKEEVFNASGTLTEFKTGDFVGKKLKISSFNQSGELQSYKIQTLGDRNRLELEEIFNANGVLQSSNVYKYNDLDGVITWITKDSSATTLATTEYKYEDNRLIETIINDPSGKKIKTYTYTYNEKKLLVEKKEFESKGENSGTTLLKYDSYGNLLSEEVKNGDNVIQRAIEYIYDKSQNPVAINYLDRRGKITEYKEIEYAPFQKTTLEKR